MIRKQKRSLLKRMYETIKIAYCSQDGLTKTSLVYRTNTTFARGSILLDFLVGQQLLEMSPTNGRCLYRTAEKGLELMKAFETIQSPIGHKELDLIKPMDEYYFGSGPTRSGAAAQIDLVNRL